MNNNIETQTSVIEATTKLAVFGVKTIWAGANLGAGSVVAISDTLANHIDKAPDSISASINKRDFNELGKTCRAVGYRATSRFMTTYSKPDNSADELLG